MSWEKDLGIDILENRWTKVLGLQGISSCSINSYFQLILYKVVHRLHYSRTKLHSIYPSVSPLCLKCKSTEGMLVLQKKKKILDGWFFFLLKGT